MSIGTLPGIWGMLVASYYALAWWAEALSVKSRLAEEGQAPFSLVMPSLYVALVLPRESLLAEYEADFREIDRYLQGNALRLEPSYPLETRRQIEFIRRIRNAVAHARAEFTDKGVLFRDHDGRSGHEFCVELSFATLGGFIGKLQDVILKRVVSIQKMQAEAGES